MSSNEKNDRKIQSSWFTTYTWLQLEGGMFFFKYCPRAKMINLFIIYDESARSARAHNTPTRR